MTHKLSHTLLGFILLIALASPTVASAQPSAGTNTLTQDDIEFIFGPGADIAAFNQLSPQEMAETDGDFWVLVTRRRVRAIADFGRSLIRGGWFRLGNYAFKFEYHRNPHHYFGRQRWGRLSGWRPHLQLNRKAIELDPKTNQPLGKTEITKHGKKIGSR